MNKRTNGHVNRKRNTQREKIDMNWEMYEPLCCWFRVKMFSYHIYTMYKAQVNRMEWDAAISTRHNMYCSSFIGFRRRGRTMKNQQSNLCIYFYMEDLCLMSQYTYFYYFYLLQPTTPFSLYLSLSDTFHWYSFAVCASVLRSATCNAIAKSE